MLRKYRFLVALVSVFVSAFVLPLRLWATGANASQDTLRISLITCEPGPDIYQVYGHTAIRVQGFGEKPFDKVYNYGTFYFDDDFLAKFVKGETDYMLGVSHFDYFMYDYIERGSSVIEQELNLTPQQEADLYNLLCINALPENRVYRYNFLYDNCATRPRDMFVALLRTYGDQVQFKPQAHIPTFRDVIKQYNANYSWSLFGMSLLLGCEIDRDASYLDLMFSPIILRDACNEATIRSTDGATRALVVRETILYNSGIIPIKPPTPWYMSPTFVAVCFMLLALYVTWGDMKRERVSRWFDTLLNLLFFVVSLIIYYQIIFSQHPATTVNFNALLFTPLAVIPAILPYISKARRVVMSYHRINMWLLALFLLIGLIGIQRYHIATYILALISLMRSVSYIGVRIPTRTRIKKTIKKRKKRK